MTYLEDKINIFKNIIVDLYYYGCLSYTDIYVIGLLYFKNNLEIYEIDYNKIADIVHDEINSLIDLD